MYEVHILYLQINTKLLLVSYLAASNFLIMWEVFSLALMYKGLFLFSSTS